MTAAVLSSPVPMLDADLPGLAAVLSPHPPGTADGDDCRVRHVDWVPRRRCSVVHEVRGPRRPTTLVTYEVTPSGTTLHQLADDGALPGLPVALDPGQLQDRLAAICGAPVRACRITPVGYRPSTRAVLAYEAEAGPGRSWFYAKLLAAGSDRYAAAAAALAEGARRQGVPPPVPEVVAVWPELGAVVQRAASGRVLSDVFRDGSLRERERLRYAELLGRLLAGVHATPVTGERRWTAEDELGALHSLLPATCHADPAAGRSLATLLDRLADAAPADAVPVLTHGAFRTGQVLLDGGALSLLDLDTVGGSDAARDAGNALAYLVWADVRGALRPGFAPALQQAFLAAYAEVGTALDERSLRWWSAAAMAKIAGRRFRSLATTEWRHVPELMARAGTHLDVSSGAARGRTRRPQTGPVAAPPVDPLDLDRMTGVLSGEPSLGTGRVRVVGARTIAEAVGRRRVLGYEVEGLDTGRTARLVGKVYADRHRSAIAYDNLRVLDDEVFASTPSLAVPSPLCHIPALRMVLYREVTGTALDGLPDGDGAAVAGLTARWLATLHGSAAVLGRRLDLAHEVVDAEQCAARVGDRAPDVRAAAYALADRLAAAAAALPVVPEVPIHKDLHAGHALAVGGEGRPGRPGAGPGGVVVIDLDEARMGDPALDVAHVTTYFDVSARPGASADRDAFLAAYGPLPGPSPELRVAFFAAWTSLKIARQLVSGRGPVLPPPGRLRTAVLTAVIQRGSACLDG